MVKRFALIGALAVFMATFIGCGGGVYYDPYHDVVVIDPPPIVADYNSLEGSILNDSRLDLYTIWLEDGYGRRYYADIDVYGGYYFIDGFPDGNYWLFATDKWQTRIWGPYSFHNSAYLVDVDLYGNFY